MCMINKILEFDIIICDRLREKEQFPAKVDFAMITPKVGGVNFGYFR